MTNEILKFENETEKFVKKEKPKKLKAKRQPRNNDAGCYVTNDQLLPEIIKSKEQGKVTPELAIMFRKIAERYALSKNYAHIPYKEDMISVAVINLLQNGLKFDPEQSKYAFSYYTQCCYHSFLTVIADEKEHEDGRDSLMLHYGLNASNGYLEKEHDDYRERHNDVFGDD